MFNNNNSITSTLVFLVILMIVLGFLVGSALSGTDLVNFLRNGAEADQMRAETAWQNQARQLELPYLQVERAAQSGVIQAQAEQQARLVAAQTEQQATLLAAQTQAQLSQIQEADRVKQAQNNLDLSARQQWTEAAISILKYFGLAVSFVLAYLGLRQVHIHTMPTQPVKTNQPTAWKAGRNPWDDPAFCHQQRSRARQVELLNLRLASQCQVPSATGSFDESSKSSALARSINPEDILTARLPLLYTPGDYEYLHRSEKE